MPTSFSIYVKYSKKLGEKLTIKHDCCLWRENNVYHQLIVFSVLINKKNQAFKAVFKTFQKNK